MQSRRYLAFALVSVPMLLSAMQFHMITVAIPDIIRELNAPLRWIGWVVTANSLASAVAMPVSGKLADEWGGRRVFAIGLALFALASLASALSPNIYALILSRLVQGFAGGTIQATAFAIIGAAFPKRRAQAIGMISSIVPMGTLLGPNVGGLIVEHLGWRWTFALNVPLCLTIAALAALVLPTPERKRSGAIDLQGAMLLATTIAGLIYAFTELSRRTADPNPAIIAASLAIAVVAGWAFLRRERRVENPIVDMDLLARKEFLATNGLNFLYGFALLGLFAFIPLYIQDVYGMSPSASGFLLTPRALAMSGMSALAAMLLPRTGYRKPIAAGLVVMGISSIVMSLGLHEPSLLGLQMSDFVYMMLLMTFVGVSYGFIGPALNNAAIELAPDRIAAISGLRGTFRSVGSTVGTAVVVLIVTRSSSTEAGLEMAFLGIGIVTLLTLVLIFRIPEMRRGHAAIEVATVEGQTPVR